MNNVIQICIVFILTASVVASKGLKLKNTVFLHIGKGGGGTVRERLAKLNIDIPRCHADPCPERVPQEKYALINIRDPVDRFFSAFNWRNLVLCDLENETRTSCSHHCSLALIRPQEYCKDDFPLEAVMLKKKYNSNPSMLAEALCEDGEAAQEAIEDLKKIQHARNNITDWLTEDILTQESTSFIAVVLEPGFDFVGQIDSAAEWLVRQRKGGAAASRHFHKLGVSVANSNVTSIANQHSSSRHGYKPPSLSALGTCCMARHLKNDYSLILKLISIACRGRRSDTCEAALISMVDRRKFYLDENLSCHDAVNMHVVEQNASEGGGNSVMFGGIMSNLRANTRFKLLLLATLMLLLAVLINITRTQRKLENPIELEEIVPLGGSTSV